MSPGEVRIRPIAPGDWRRLREIRLRALSDDPLAFASSLEREQAFSDAEWRRRASSQETHQTFGAAWGEELVGLATAIREPPRPAELVGMWVAPKWRRQGLARRLVDAVRAWQREGEELLLWVAEGNLEARRCYERLGLVYTGQRQPFPSDPSRHELQMRVGG